MSYKLIIWIAGILSLALVVLTLVFLEDISNQLYFDLPNRKGLTIDLLVKCLGGIVLFFGIWFGLVRANASKISADAQTKAVRAQNEQIELSRNTQLNELFKSAVDHLGSPNETVVLAGAHELHSIANKFPEDYSEIALNVFLSILRIELTAKDLSESKKSLCQGIINIIFRNEIYDEHEKDLSDCNFSGLNFGGLNLTNVNLIRSKFPISTSGCGFKKCDFRNSELRTLSFIFCNFDKCYFDNTLISEVTFHRCSFDEVSNNIWFKFYDVSFFECTFIGYLNRINFQLSRFIGVKFKKGILQDLEFMAVTFTDNCIIEVNVLTCDFIAVSFTDTEFKSQVSSNNFVGIENFRYHYDSFHHLIEKENNFNGMNLTSLELSRLNNTNITFDSGYNEYVRRELGLGDEVNF